MAKHLDETPGRKIPVWQQANLYYVEDTPYPSRVQSKSKSSTKSNNSYKPSRSTKKGDTVGVGEYAVSKGDSLWKIAQANGTTVEALKAANPEIKGNMIYPGQIIKVNTNQQQKEINTSTNIKTNNNNNNKSNNTKATLNYNVIKTNKIIAEYQAKKNKNNNNNLSAAQKELMEKYGYSYSDVTNPNIARNAKQILEFGDRVRNRPDYEGVKNFMTLAATAPLDVITAGGATIGVKTMLNEPARVAGRVLRRSIKNTKLPQQTKAVIRTVNSKTKKQSGKVLTPDEIKGGYIETIKNVKTLDGSRTYKQPYIFMN